jgi:thiamine biosynthesis lipoprotein
MAAGRRQFLLAVGGAAGLAALGGAALWRNGLRRIERTAAALGTSVTIQVLHDDAAGAAEALDAAFAEIEQVESVMSIYRPDSQLRRLNRHGVLRRPHRYLLEVLQHAQATSQATDGAFDITVQPLWDLYDRAKQRGELPTRAALAHAMTLVDWQRVDMQPERIRMRQLGMQVTLNGIAQGYAADRARAALKAHGIQHALIDAGELAPLGRKEGASPWQAGIQHPRVDDAYIALASLDNRCLATSGDYATKFTADGKYNHIFDPRLGTSPQELASVSIAAPTAMAADALSTACFVLGATRAQEVLRKIPDVDALFVLKNGRVLRTNSFPIQA